MSEGRLIHFPRTIETSNSQECPHMDTPTQLMQEVIQSLQTHLPLRIEVAHVTERIVPVDVQLCDAYKHVGALCFFEGVRSEGGLKTFRICVQDCTQRPAAEDVSVQPTAAELLNLPTVRVSIRTTEDGAQYSRWFQIEKTGERDELLGALYAGAVQTEQE